MKEIKILWRAEHLKLQILKINSELAASCESADKWQKDFNKLSFFKFIVTWIM